MKNSILLIVFMLVGSFVLKAQSEREQYLNVINNRADKIVKELGIQDQTTYKEVVKALVHQYDQLNSTHENLEAAIQGVKQNQKFSKEQQQAEIEKLRAAQEKELAILHAGFIKNLEKNLEAEQIAQVKDGMTYHILPKTYTAYQDMILGLTSHQKDSILAMLTEAREKAIDAPSSDAKHAVFGKYKGRINNYLSKEGYDLKKEGDLWKIRIEKQKTKGTKN